MQSGDPTNMDTTYCDYDCKSFYFTPLNILDAAICVKAGKSADEEGLSVEHVHFAPLSMLKRLSSYFNMMLNHGFVPNQFCKGFMVPLIKDQSGNHSDLGNYHGITISPCISKLFEHALKYIFFDHLTTSQHQFGFKKNSSIVYALHCLKHSQLLCERW